MQLDTMYVGNLPREITEDELRACFLPFGSIQQIRLNTDKCFAFIKYVHASLRLSYEIVNVFLCSCRFDSTDAASRAVASFQGKLIGGRAIKVGWGRERKPQRSVPYMLGMTPTTLLASQSGLITYPYMYAPMSPPSAAAAASGEWYYPSPYNPTNLRR